MAPLAAATGDKILGAALVSIIDRMPAKARPFSVRSLADHLVGDEVRRVRAAIAAIRNAAQGTIVRNRALEWGKPRPHERLQLALKKKDTT